MLPGVIAIAGGLTAQLATKKLDTLTILGCVMAAVCLSGAARLSWIAHREQPNHVGH
jgi:hypothetical protein